MSDLLHLKDISMHFGAVMALDRVDISVGRGEVLALLGDNGAGKSTLIKVISGGLKPSGGKIFFEGEERVFESPSSLLTTPSRWASRPSTKTSPFA
ncbi:ATP-binding cassette domain-containing protein [Mesorhizobium sp. LSHC414A00]|uniref:ATP-binding cassette domain-containing protein n=1 Tax=Mesorhizobium sp. LSHC414A00 TaxID=1287287 RepID=UPI002476BCC5|nr:ATP-binding cassette domain-containing protein [Mesorhizobium sp. LSHC414A00]